MTRWIAAAALALGVALLTPTPAHAAESPTLDDVLASVDRHLPLLVSAQAQLDAARGKQLAAAGAWDPSLSAGGWWKTGPYDQGYATTTLSQDTPLYGLSLDVGYRVGLGKFATYDGWYDTLDGGELFADATLPLLKGGLTDARRTDVLVTRANADAYDAKLEQVRIKAAAQARVAWWKWVAAGEKVRIARAMQDVAHTTASAVDTRIARGDQRPLDATDARRVVVERQSKLLDAERGLQVAALELGLYLRGPDGAPAPPLDVEPTPLPAVDTPDLPDADDAVGRALQARPDVANLTAQQRAVLARQRFARVELLPKLDLKVRVAQDLPGADQDPEPLEVKVGGEVGFTLAQRPARGKLLAASAEAAAVDAELAWLRDQVAAEVRGAVATVQAAHARGVLADERLALSRQLEEAVRTAYALGDVDLFAVYLREQSTLDAALSRVDAWADYHVAHAKLQAALGAR